MRRITLKNNNNIKNGNSTRIVILGGGFGGVYCAKRLESLLAKRKIHAQIILISKQNFFVFTPMLPQVVSGMIESNHVVVPIRQILKKTMFYEADVISIDEKNSQVILRVNNDNGVDDNASSLTSISSSDLTLEYDHLVISLGSDTNFMNLHNGPISSSVFALKNLKDALMLRNHIIDMLERADIERDFDKRRQMLNFVIVGGGLSGVETAAELNSFFRKVIKYYPNLKEAAHFARNKEQKKNQLLARVTLIQSRDYILPELNSELSAYTLKKMKDDGISIILNTKVVDVAKGIVSMVDKDNGKQSTISSNTVIWTAGISPNPVTLSIPRVEGMESSGRLPVDKFLRVKGWENIWAVGDCAYILHESTGDPVPPTAQYAQREADVAAKNIVSSIIEKNKASSGTAATDVPYRFEYARDAQMALIGSRCAIAKIAGMNLSGFLIWCIWRAVYLKKLPMFKKRLRVLVDWTIDAFFDPDLTHLRGLKELRESRIIEKSIRDSR